MNGNEAVMVTMTLSGARNDVMEIVGLAVAGGTLSGLQVREPEHDHTEPIRPDGKTPLDYYGKPIRVGDRVTQMGASSYLGLEKATKGQHGKVAKVVRAGKGFSITVEWDGGTDTDAYGRLLARHG
jgi:hypothetical protein